jgi:hypothetical protein
MASLKLESKAATPRQYAMIGALAALLIGVLCWPADETALVDAGPAAPRGAPAAQMAAKNQTAPKAKTWPTANLDAALRHDPFTSPLLTAQQEVAEQDDGKQEVVQQEDIADLLALKQDGVSMIVRGGEGMIAAVGDRKLRVGDVIGGYRVVAIEMDGVVLERVTGGEK